MSCDELDDISRPGDLENLVRDRRTWQQQWPTERLCSPSKKAEDSMAIARYDDVERNTYIIVVYMALTYTGILLYPYLRSDDTYLIYFYRQFKMLDTGMGRPVFWYLVDINGYLSQIVGSTSIIVFRVIGLITMMGAAVVWNRWLLRFGVPPNQSLAATVGICTLPSYQVIIGNGCWLAPAVFASIYASTRLYDLIHASKLISWKGIGCAILIFLCLATYQIFGFLSAIGAIVPLIWTRDVDAAEIRKRFNACIRLIVVIVCVVIFYYILWQIALRLVPPVVGGGDYLPTQKSGIVENVLAGFRLLGATRDGNWPIPRIANLWRVASDFNALTVVLVFLSGVGLISLCHRESLKPAVQRISGVLLVIFFQYTLFWLLDGKHHMVRYTTIIGVTTGISLLFVRGVEFATSFFWKHFIGRFWLVLALVLAIGASYNFNKYIIVPSITENLFTKVRLDSFDPRAYDGILVKLKTHSGDNRAEFTFSNQHQVYASYLVLSYLKDRRLNQDVAIRVINDKEEILSQNVSNSELWHSGRVFVIDYKYLPMIHDWK